MSKEGACAINLPPFIIHYSLFDIRYSNKNQLQAPRLKDGVRGFKRPNQCALRPKQPQTSS
jgi:hypothetical protein